MILKNIRMCSMGKLFLILIFVAAIGACSESSPPSKQEVAPSPENRLTELQKKADAGDAEAQFTLGEMYYKDEGVPKDAVKAVEWYQKAAAQGHAEAQYNIGEMYDRGEGVPKNYTKAVEWYKKAMESFQKAAAQGHADAQYYLGVMYYYGKSVPKNAAKAIEWYQKASSTGRCFCTVPSWGDVLRRRRRAKGFGSCLCMV
jgi:TPR repeat protein